MCESEAKRLGWQIESHPADWKRHAGDCSDWCRAKEICKRAGYLRNEKMVNLGADLLIAFRRAHSNGTTHTINLAADAGIPYWLYTEDE